VIGVGVGEIHFQQSIEPPAVDDAHLVAARGRMEWPKTNTTMPAVPSWI
jgi:hypothetical protein